MDSKSLGAKSFFSDKNNVEHCMDNIGINDVCQNRMWVGKWTNNARSRMLWCSILQNVMLGSTQIATIVIEFSWKSPLPCHKHSSPGCLLGVPLLWCGNIETIRKYKDWQMSLKVPKWSSQKQSPVSTKEWLIGKQTLLVHINWFIEYHDGGFL